MWDATHVSALSYGSGLDGNDLLLRVSRVIIIGMADLVLCLGTITFIGGGSDDMKSDVVVEKTM